MATRTRIHETLFDFDIAITSSFDSPPRGVPILVGHSAAFGTTISASPLILILQPRCSRSSSDSPRRNSLGSIAPPEAGLPGQVFRGVFVCHFPARFFPAMSTIPAVTNAPNHALQRTAPVCHACCSRRARRAAVTPASAVALSLGSLGDCGAFFQTRIEEPKPHMNKVTPFPIVRRASRGGGPVLRLAPAGLADRPGDAVADGQLRAAAPARFSSSVHARRQSFIALNTRASRSPRRSRFDRLRRPGRN